MALIFIVGILAFVALWAWAVMDDSAKRNREVGKNDRSF